MWRREDYLKEIKQKDIVLWGMGKRGKEFYQNYNQILSIKYCTGSDLKEEIIGLEPISKEAVLTEKRSYIIVCSSYYYEISRVLIAQGYQIGKDFIDSRLFETIYHKKKLFLCVGQCELEWIKTIFIQIPEIKNEYEIYYFDEYKLLGIKEREPKLEFLIEVNFIIRMADIYLYPVNITNERKNYYEGLYKKTKPGCLAASIPLTTFEGYWPQDKTAYYEDSPFYVTQWNHPIRAWQRRDSNLEKMISIGMSTEEILNKICDCNFYSVSEIEKNFEYTIKKIIILEKAADIKISDFVKKNYRNKLLYMDRGHVSKDMLYEYAKRILNFLNFSDLIAEKVYSTTLEEYEKCHGEFPIYPSVIKYLRLIEPKDKYQIMKQEGTIKLDFCEYMRAYITYMKYSLKLQEVW